MVSAEEDGLVKKSVADAVVEVWRRKRTRSRHRKEGGVPSLLGRVPADNSAPTRAGLEQARDCAFACLSSCSSCAEEPLQPVSLARRRVNK